MEWRYNSFNFTGLGANFAHEQALMAQQQFQSSQFTITASDLVQGTVGRGEQTSNNKLLLLLKEKR